MAVIVFGGQAIYFRSGSLNFFYEKYYINRYPGCIDIGGQLQLHKYYFNLEGTGYYHEAIQ